ncbi:hypothetical protein [Oscillibacter ruminantium]|uniref:hypothetical protein n=1 Tax=Oscillibacter ruminantium TaxID=1263547 RepID=UPI00058D9B5C|nr:hypothetical protein [Oscillibacter ruminantium]
MGGDLPTYLCVQQRAGPFVKAFVTDRQCFIRRNGVSTNSVRKRCGPAMCRTSVDKLELRLALFGYDGVFYTLTFADEHLPDSLDGVMHVWDAFCKRLKRFCKKPMDYYVYRIEGLHGDHRYHIHAFMRDADFPSAVVRYLWVWGEAYDVPYDQKRVMAEQGYRGLAIYFTKELPDVGRHPWGCSRKLSKLIPPPEVHMSNTGQLRVPRDAVRLPIFGKPDLGAWGVFNYTRYLLPKK